MSRVLIKDGCVLTLDPRIGNLRRGDVLIEDGRIAEVGVDLRARDAALIDASQSIVMPGFCDTHRHVWKSLFRNSGEGARPFEYGPHYQPEDVYAATLAGLFGGAEAGITTVVDWADFAQGNAYTDAAIEAHLDSGMRTVFTHSSPGWDLAPGSWGPDLRRLVGQPRSPLTTVAAAARVPDDWALARELGLRVHVHAGTGDSDIHLVADLAEQRLLASDVTLVHCSLLRRPDFEAIASSGAGVSVCPSSEMVKGLQPPIQMMVDLGIEPGLGVDTERLASGDIFAQMRATISLQHARSFDLKLAGKAGLSRLMTTRDVIRFGTLVGARAVGLSAVTGSLEPGKQADIVVLRTDRPNIFPVNDPVGAVVWGMDTSNVDWVLVGGRALVADGVLQTDVARVRGLALDAQHRVVEAAGLMAGTRSGGSQ